MITKLKALGIAGLFLFSASVLFAAEPPKGATFFTDEGGDLDKLLERKHPDNATGTFVIEVDQLPTETAQLSINAYDIDEERGEANFIYFNGKKLGRLSGTNNTWNTSVFDIDLGLVKTGANEVKIEIADNSKAGTINWSGKVGWGQLLIDGGAGDAGEMKLLEIVVLHKENKVKIHTELLAKQEGAFKLETNLIDPEGNAVDTLIDEPKIEPGESITLDQVVNFDSSLPTATYQVVSNLFFEREGMWVQQMSRKKAYDHISSAVKVIVAKPLGTVNMTEDQEPLLIPLEGLFSLVGADDPALKPEITLAPNEARQTLLAEIREGQLQLTPLKDQNGVVKLSLIAQIGRNQTPMDFTVHIAPVDDAPVIQQPLTDVTLLLGASEHQVNLGQVFTDIDSKQENITYKLTVPPENKLVQGRLQGQQIHFEFTPRELGKVEVRLQATSDGKTAEDTFFVVVNPPDSPRVDQEPPVVTLEEDQDTFTLPLKGLFADPGLEKGQEIKLSLQSGGDENLLSVKLSGQNLSLTPNKDQFGQTNVVVRGNSRGMFADAVIPVTVTPVDDAPYQVKDFPEVELTDEAPQATVDFAPYIADIDHPAADIHLSIKNNDKPNLLKPEFSGKVLNLTAGEGKSGYAALQLEATAGEQSSTFDYPVYVEFYEPWEFYAYANLGIDSVSGYEGNSPVFAAGMGVVLERYMTGLQGEVEYFSGSAHSTSESVYGYAFETDLQYSVAAAFVRWNLGAPDWLLEYAPWLEGYEINLRAGPAMVSQTLSSTAQDLIETKDKPDISGTKTVIAGGGGMSYWWTENLAVDAMLTKYAADITTLSGGIRYHKTFE